MDSQRVRYYHPTPTCPRSPLSSLRESISTPWTTVLEHKHEPERGDHRTEGVVGFRVRAPGRTRPSQRTARRPSPCGCPARAHKGLSPREDHASNLVGLVRDIIGLLGWRRPFRAVRHIGQKWTTCTPGMLYKASWVPQSRRARSARTSPPQRARAARASEGV